MVSRVFCRSEAETSGFKSSIVNYWLKKDGQAPRTGRGNIAPGEALRAGGARPTHHPAPERGRHSAEPRPRFCRPRSAAISEGQLIRLRKAAVANQTLFSRGMSRVQVGFLKDGSSEV